MGDLSWVKDHFIEKERLIKPKEVQAQRPQEDEL